MQRAHKHNHTKGCTCPFCKMKPPAPLSKAEEAVIDALAHIELVAGLSKAIPGMEGFFDHYLNDILTPKQRQIWGHFRKRVQQTHADAARMMKESGWDKGNGDATS